MNPLCTVDEQLSLTSLENRLDFGGGDRSKVVIPLCLVASVFGQKSCLFGIFYPFGDQIEIEVLRHRDDRKGELNVVMIVRQSPYERLIDFDFIDGEPFEVGER